MINLVQLLQEYYQPHFNSGFRVIRPNTELPTDSFSGRRALMVPFVTPIQGTGPAM
jgi:hypothetical protein